MILVSGVFTWGGITGRCKNYTAIHMNGRGLPLLEEPPRNRAKTTVQLGDDDG